MTVPYTRNISDFGAAMNGTTDDTAAVLAAINDLPSTGGDVTIPSGPCRLDGPIAFNKPGAILGRGGGTRIYKGSSGSDLFVLGGTFQTIGNFNAEPTIAQNNCSLINVTSSASRTTISDLNTTGGSGSGFSRAVTSQGIATLTINDCDLLEIQGGTGVAIMILAGLDVSLRNIVTDTSSSNRMAAGLQVVSAGDITVSDCNFINAVNALLINPQQTGQEVDSLWADNCFFDTSDTCLTISPLGGGVVQRCRFNGCWASSASNNGVYIVATGGNSKVDGMTFIDLHAFGNHFNGMTVGQTQGGQTLRVRMIGGSFAGNQIHGINFDAGVSDMAVTNAVCGPTSGFGANGQYGIAVQSGSSNNYMIMNNQLGGNGIGGLFDGGTGSNKIVGSNLT